MKNIKVATQEEFDNLPDSFEEETDIHILKGATVKVKGGKENGLVVAHDGSRVDAYGGSRVYALNGSSVYAYKGSYVKAFKGSSVVAFEGSDVKYLN